MSYRERQRLADIQAAEVAPGLTATCPYLSARAFSMTEKLMRSCSKRSDGA